MSRRAETLTVSDFDDAGKGGRAVCAKVLITASGYGHIAHFHQPYLRAFRDAGWEVHVACAGEPRALDGAAKCFSVPFHKKMTSPDNFRAARMLRRILRRERYDLVITHTSLAAFFTRLATFGVRPRPKLINMVHGYLFDDDSPFLKRQILLLAERLMARRTDLLLTMNDYDRRLAERCRLGRRTAFVPGLGVEDAGFAQLAPDAGQQLRASLGIAPETFVLFYAAEFSPRKNQTLLLHAMTRLPERVTLVLAGEGALREECMQLAQTLGVSDRVRFPGFVQPAEPWFCMADAVVSSSRSEGLPFNLMEAMLAGRPVCASAVKGHTDLIRDGENGLLFPFADPEACAAAIDRLQRDPALCQRLGAQAKADAQQYRLERVFPLVWEQYLSLTK